MAVLSLNISVNLELSRFDDHNSAVLTLSLQAVKMPAPKKIKCRLMGDVEKGSSGMLKGSAIGVGRIVIPV